MSAALRLSRPALRTASMPIGIRAFSRVSQPMPMGSVPVGMGKNLVRPSPSSSFAGRQAVAAGVALPAVATPLVPGSRAFSLWPFHRSKAHETDPAAAGATPAADPAATESLSSAVGDAVDTSAGSAAEVAASSSESVQNAASGAADALNTTAGSAAEGASHALDAVTPSTAVVPVDEFAAAGLPAGWLAVPYAQSTLNWLAVHSGLPWWAVIVGVTAGMRILLFPLTVWGQKMTINLANVTPKMKPLMEEYKYAKKTNDSRALQKSGQRLQSLMAANGITGTTAIKSMIPSILPLPIFITMFFAINGIAESGLTSMMQGGFLWLPDLTKPDPYMALPILTSLTQLVSMEASRMIDGKDENTQQMVMKNAFRIGLLISPFFLKNWASGVLLMWLSNAVLGSIQSVALKRPTIMKKLGLPNRVPDLRPINLSEKNKNFFDKGKDKILALFKKHQDPDAVLRERQAAEKQRSLQKRRAALERLSPPNSQSASSGLSGNPRRPASKKRM